jgi:hypothetical protein
MSKKQLVLLIFAISTLGYSPILPDQACGGGQVGYIDKQGRLAIIPEYRNARNFSEGLAPVQIEDKWGYIDKTGKMIIPAQFEKAEEFSHGLAAIKINKQWGYINQTGKVALKAPVEVNGINDFSEGFSAIWLRSKYRC